MKLVRIDSVKPGARIRWPRSTIAPDPEDSHEGYLIGLHEPSGFYRISADPGSDKAHWTLDAEKLVEVVT